MTRGGRPLEAGLGGVGAAVFLSETSVGLFTPRLFTRGSWKAAKV